MKLGLGLSLTKSNVVTTAGLLNTYSLNFDGDDEYVDIGDSDDLMVGTNVTISTWFKNSSGTRAYMFQSRRGSTSTNLSVGVNMNASGVEQAGWIGIVIYTGSGHSYTSVDGNVDDGAWHHFAVTISDGGQKLYLDGSEVASASNAFPNDASGHHSIIGSNSGSNRFMNGNIDEVALWNAVLDADAITAIYNSGAPTDLSSDSGDYDNSSNLQGWWRMGDNADLPYPFITDEKGTVGAELVVDGSSNWVGDFDVSGDISSWASTDSGELAISHDSSNNAMQLTGGSSSSAKWVYYTATVEVGELYAVSLKMISRNDSSTVPNIRVGRTVGGTEYFNIYYSSFITQGKIFRASTNTTCIIAIGVNGNDNDAGFDNISLKKVSEQTGFVTNMESADISTEVPKQVINLQAVLNTFSLDFDGIDEYVNFGDVSAIDSLSAITISSWIKCSSTGGTNPIFSKYKDDNENIQLLVNGNKILFQVENSNDCSADFAYTSNDWNHIVAVFDGSGGTNADKCKIYLNGVSQTLTFSGTFPSSVDDLSGYDTYIGRRSSGYYIGNIDEVALWNTALDGNAVKAIYNGGNPTDLKVDNGAYDEYTDNLQAYWRMGDGTLDTFPLIADQVNPTLGSDLFDADAYATGTGNWFAYTGNTIENDDGAIKTTYGGSANGSFVYFRDAYQLSSDLTVGKIYKLTFNVKTNSGSSVNVEVHDGSSATFAVTGVTSTDYIAVTHYFVAANATTAYIRTTGLGSGEIIWIKNMILREVQGNAGFMNNMASGNIEEDTP
tara:strand:- start:4516 stop:6855 length:2340 start_codon:yes stop_codon:yes gene_type:complete